jgi:hypothetical protein
MRQALDKARMVATAAVIAVSLIADFIRQARS